MKLTEQQTRQIERATATLNAVPVTVLVGEEKTPVRFAPGEVLLVSAEGRATGTDGDWARGTCRRAAELTHPSSGFASSLWPDWLELFMR